VVSAGCHSSVRGGAHKWAPPLAYEKLETNWYLICWSAVWDVETPQDRPDSEMEAIVRDRVEKALDLVRPSLQADGGNVELVDVDEATGVVKVKLVGACGSCPMSQMTLRMGVERVLREQVPEVKEVVAL